MVHRFEYRIGRFAHYTQEQWEAAPGATTAQVERNLRNTPPASWFHDVYAVIVDKDGIVVKCSKHPCPVIGQAALEAMQKEIALYARANELPVFDRDQFGVWDYLVTNSEDLNPEIIQEELKSLG